MTDWIVNQKPKHPYVIFDIDGTVADDSHRLHHIDQSRSNIVMASNPPRMKPPNWDAYHDEMVRDKPIKPVVDLYHRFCHYGTPHNHQPIFITGRPESHRKQTQEWLRLYDMDPTMLFMRPTGDYRSSVDFKRKVMRENIGSAPVLFIVEDRTSLVKMFRELGYFVLQCQEGNF